MKLLRIFLCAAHVFKYTYVTIECDNTFCFHLKPQNCDFAVELVLRQKFQRLWHLLATASYWIIWKMIFNFNSNRSCENRRQFNNGLFMT